MALAGLSGMLFIILIQHIGILLGHTSACNEVTMFARKKFYFSRDSLLFLSSSIQTVS